MMDTLDKFHIYIETKLGQHINDKNTVNQNILFDLLRGSYRKSWATFFACELGTAEEGECGGRWNSCCVILECLVTSIACITWLVSLLTKWPTTICRFASVLSSNSLWKRKSLLQKFTRDFSVLKEVCAWVRAGFEGGWNVLKMGKRRKFRKQCVSVFGWLEWGSTAGEYSNFQNAGRNVYKEVAIMWKNKECYVD